MFRARELRFAGLFVGGSPRALTTAFCVLQHLPMFRRTSTLAMLSGMGLLTACKASVSGPQLHSCYQAGSLRISIHGESLTAGTFSAPIHVEKRKIGWVASVPAVLGRDAAGAYAFRPSTIGDFDWQLPAGETDRIIVAALDGGIVTFHACGV